MRKELKTMKNTLKIDFNGKKIVMDRTFAKNCTNTRKTFATSNSRQYNS